MRAQKLKEVALQLFSEHGYEPTSMALIAENSGIKKQSFYNHFKSKEELFFQIYHETLKEELSYIKGYFQKSDNFKENLEGFLIDFLERCENNPNTRFFIRTSFFPPINFKNQIIEYTNSYIEGIEGILDSYFENFKTEFKCSKNEAIMTYLTILDGLLVETQYGEMNRLKKRQKYSWIVYWNGITN